MKVYIPTTTNSLERETMGYGKYFWDYAEMRAFRPVFLDLEKAKVYLREVLEAELEFLQEDQIKIGMMDPDLDNWVWIEKPDQILFVPPHATDTEVNIWDTFTLAGIIGINEVKE